MIQQVLRVIPLGGLGEIGRNMLVLEYDEQLLIVDAGLMFPDADMYGVEYIIPDFTYVVERVEQVLGIVVTHGHEDHIGALQHLLRQVPVPVYATPLTRALIQSRVRDARGVATQMIDIKPRDRFQLGPFTIECFHMSHSIPDTLGLAIETPLGLVVHSGDFKLDASPADGLPSDIERLTSYGERGTLLLLSDSTNAESPGTTASEQALGVNLRNLFETAPGRVVIAMFASNISRVQQVADIARATGRRIALVGKSMVNNVRIASELGYVNIDPTLFIPASQLHSLPDREAAIICTGSQGESASALVRMGMGDSSALSLQPGDTVIVSAAPIPGNEESVNRTLDNLFRLGAQVYYDDVYDVHVSGHASQEELKELIRLVRPRYLMPIHGEYRHLVWHRRLAESFGMLPENIFVLESGDVLEITNSGAVLGERIGVETVYVDRSGKTTIGAETLAERSMLSQDGILVVTVNLDKYTGGLVGTAHFMSRGMLTSADAEALYKQLREPVATAVNLGGSKNELTKRLDYLVARLVEDLTGRRPVIVVQVLKV
ncbi:MAG: ribonuclease J [Chloroflexi bacterium]|nr:ribonuclease J [Chloroflexota bacterium]